MNIIVQWIFTDEKAYHVKRIPGYLYDFCCSEAGIVTDDFNTRYQLIISKYSLFTPISFELKTNESTTVYDVIEGYLDFIDINHDHFYDMCFEPSILTRKECLCIEDTNIPLITIFKHFDCGESLHICFFLTLIQGEVFNDNNISYYIHSNERTHHNLPHVHVKKRGKYEVVIDFIELKVIKTSGNITQKELKAILSVIEQKRTNLIEYWNNRTNGISIAIDYTLKYM
jgi:hypothetical protein